MAEFPYITYHISGERKEDTKPPAPIPEKPRVQKPKRKAPSAASSILDFEPEKTDVAKFWDLYHELPETQLESEDISAIKSKLTTIATEKGYTFKTEPDKTIATIIQLDHCPWSGETCPCQSLINDGECKRGLFR